MAAFDPAAFRLQMRGKLESRRAEWDLYRVRVASPVLAGAKQL